MPLPYHAVHRRRVTGNPWIHIEAPEPKKCNLPIIGKRRSLNTWYGDMVLMSMENYERMVRMAKIYEELEELECQMEAGQTMNAREHLASVREKYGL